MLNYVAASVLIYAARPRAPSSDPAATTRSRRGSTTPPRSRAVRRQLRRPPRCASSRCSPRVGVWWLLERSTWGFELRAVGANADAARTAGMSVAKVYTLAMLARRGARRAGRRPCRCSATRTRSARRVPGSIGFDAITVALLGRASPLGTVLAGAAVRRAERRRRGDAGQRRHADGAHRRPAGADRAVRGRAGAGQGDLAASRSPAAGRPSWRRAGAPDGRRDRRSPPRASVDVRDRAATSAARSSCLAVLRPGRAGARLSSTPHRRLHRHLHARRAGHPGRPGQEHRRAADHDRRHRRRRGVLAARRCSTRCPRVSCGCWSTSWSASPSSPAS